MSTLTQNIKPGELEQLLWRRV